MKLFSIAGFILFSITALAHQDSDWRQDFQAYLSIEYSYSIPFAPVSKRPVKPDLAAALNMDFFKEKLSILSGERPYLIEGKEVLITERKSQKRLNWARAFLAEEYKKLGFTVSTHVFGSGTNFIAEKIGATDPDKILILSSHIDSVGNAGANDDGTGTIGLLTLARELAQKKYDVTIRILGFDREEVGLKGSDAYVATLPETENIIGDIHFEMMGVNSREDGAFHLIDCDRKDSLFLSKAIKTSITDLDLPLTLVKTCTDRSDHASFWRHDIPAVVISENFFGGDGDPCYHDTCDVMDERLNYDYIQNILTSVQKAIDTLTLSN